MRIFNAATLATGLFALFLATASSVSAATLTVVDITASWSNIQGGQYVTNTVTGDGTAQLRWGYPATYAGKSGYDFNPTDTPFDVQAADPFVLGEFTHINEPILSGTAITGAQLDIFIDIGDGAGPYKFSFAHNETPNVGYPGCCNDIVTISDLVTSDTVTILNQLYTLTILGFSTDHGQTYTMEFSSPEGGSNSAELYAHFTTVTPLPAALPLFLTMLGGLGWLKWRRSKALAA